MRKQEQDTERAGVLQHLIVDEYQDINPAQEALIRIIGAGGSIFVVGDPWPPIFQWKGSDEDCFQRFLKNHPDVSDIILPENRIISIRIANIVKNLATHFPVGVYTYHPNPVSSLVREMRTPSVADEAEKDRRTDPVDGTL
jgi:DNA helicase-2/ATP-dependent DNA helicase PcrA